MHQFTCSLAQEDYRGWKAIRLSNGIVQLFVVPEIGGRIIQFRLGSRDLFYVNPRHRGRVYKQQENCVAAGWKNYGGSKVWPAPQGWESKEQWPGPPDPVLDGGPYTWRAMEHTPESVAIHLESQPDEYTGLTFSREIRLRENAATVQILHTIRNTSSRRVSWAVWQVTQQAVDSELVIYTPARDYRQMFGDVPFKQVALEPDKGLWKLAYTDRVAKFAVQAEAGWLAALRPDQPAALVEDFPLFPSQPYPDGAPVEFWVNGPGTFTLPGGRVDMSRDPNGCDPFIETEILSPLVDLNPGQEYTFPVTWRAASLSAPRLAKVNPLALVSDPLTITPDGQDRHVTCEFGTFQAGFVELVSLNRLGEPQGVIALGEITPLEPCRVDQPMRTHDQVKCVRLQLRDTHGRLAGTIDEL
jgi:hypothetical protein